MGDVHESPFFNANSDEISQHNKLFSTFRDVTIGEALFREKQTPLLRCHYTATANLAPFFDEYRTSKTYCL